MSLLEPIRIGVLMDYVPADWEGFGDGYESYPDIFDVFRLVADEYVEEGTRPLVTVEVDVGAPHDAPGVSVAAELPLVCGEAGDPEAVGLTVPTDVARVVPPSRIVAVHHELRRSQDMPAATMNQRLMTFTVHHPCDPVVTEELEVRHHVEDTIVGPQRGRRGRLAAVDRGSVARDDLCERVAILELSDPDLQRRETGFHVRVVGHARHTSWATVSTEPRSAPSSSATSTHTATSLRMNRPATSTRVAADPVPIAVASA